MMSSTSHGGVGGRGWTAAGVTASLAPLILASCALTPRQKYERQCLETSKPALHAVQSCRLEQIMGDLDRLEPGEWPQEMDLGLARDERIREASEVAGAMAATSAGIADILEGVRLSEEDRQVFIGLADRLREEAAALDKVARRKNVPQMERAWRKIGTTCSACHSEFRVLPVVTASSH